MFIISCDLFLFPPLPIRSSDFCIHHSTRYGVDHLPCVVVVTEETSVDAFLDHHYCQLGTRDGSLVNVTNIYYTYLYDGDTSLNAPNI